MIYLGLDKIKHPVQEILILSWETASHKIASSEDKDLYSDFTPPFKTHYQYFQILLWRLSYNWED